MNQAEALASIQQVEQALSALLQEHERETGTHTVYEFRYEVFLGGTLWDHGGQQVIVAKDIEEAFAIFGALIGRCHLTVRDICYQEVRRDYDPTTKETAED